jgi:thiosulfate reductase cytochrome b subunit
MSYRGGSIFVKMMETMRSNEQAPNALLTKVSSYVRGHAVALRFKSGVRGFDSRWSHWNFSLTSDLTMTLGSTQPLTEVSTRRSVRTVHYVATFILRLSGKLVVSTSWNSRGLSRSVLG